MTSASIRDAAKAAKRDSNGNNQKLVESFIEKVPENPEDVLSQKRRTAILSPRKSKTSIYQNPRFWELCATLITDSASERRIWGGKKTKPGEFKACVAVGNDAEYFCSGTLIAKRIVCTASHCAALNPTKVFVGSSLTSNGREYRVRANGVFRHPDYHENSSMHNDLALLLLEEDVDVADPVPIATTRNCEAMKTVRIVGFGNTDKAGTFGFGTRRMADVLVISPDGIRFGGQEYGADANLEFVAEDLHSDTCKGDSGGPAFLADIHGKWFLAGATSRATTKSEDSDAVCGDGGIYVRVDSYLDWIRKVAVRNGFDFPK